MALLANLMADLAGQDQYINSIFIQVYIRVYTNCCTISLILNIRYTSESIF
jgi:hypothetical protein